MSGYPAYNFPAFHAASARLREAGYEVISPAESHTERPGDLPWREYMRRDLIALLIHTDGVALLPGYRSSTGAQAEMQVAQVVGMEAKLVDRWLEDVE